MSWCLNNIFASCFKPPRAENREPLLPESSVPPRSFLAAYYDYFAEGAAYVFCRSRRSPQANIYPYERFDELAPAPEIGNILKDELNDLINPPDAPPFSELHANKDFSAKLNRILNPIALSAIARGVNQAVQQEVVDQDKKNAFCFSSITTSTLNLRTALGIFVLFQLCYDKFSGHPDDTTGLFFAQLAIAAIICALNVPYFEKSVRIFWAALGYGLPSDEEELYARERILRLSSPDNSIVFKILAALSILILANAAAFTQFLFAQVDTWYLPATSIVSLSIASLIGIAYVFANLPRIPKAFEVIATSVCRVLQLLQLYQTQRYIEFYNQEIQFTIVGNNDFSFYCKGNEVTIITNKCAIGRFPSQGQTKTFTLTADRTNIILIDGTDIKLTPQQTFRRPDGYRPTDNDDMSIFCDLEVNITAMMDQTNTMRYTVAKSFSKTLKYALLDINLYILCTAACAFYSYPIGKWLSRFLPSISSDNPLINFASRNGIGHLFALAQIGLLLYELERLIKEMMQIKKFSWQSCCNFYGLTALILSIIGLAAPPFALGLSGFLQDLSQPASNIPFAIAIASLSVINAFPRARPLQACLERLHHIYLSNSERGCQKFLHILQEIYFPTPRSILAYQREAFNDLLIKWKKAEAATKGQNNSVDIAATEAIANQVRNKLFNFFMSVALKQIQTAYPNPWCTERIKHEISLFNHVGDFNDPLHDPLNSLSSILMDTSVPLPLVITVLQVMIGLVPINAPESSISDVSNSSSAIVNVLNELNIPSPPPSTITLQASVIQHQSSPDSALNDSTFLQPSGAGINLMPPPGFQGSDINSSPIITTPVATRPSTPTAMGPTRDGNAYLASPLGVRTRPKRTSTDAGLLPVPTTFAAVHMPRLQGAATASANTGSSINHEGKHP